MHFKTDKQTIFLFLLMFPHLKPPSLEYLAPALETAFDVGRTLSTGIILLLLLAERKKPSPALIFFAAMELWIIATTAIFNSRYLAGALINCSSVVIVFAMIEYYSRKCPGKLLHALEANLGWILAVNLITVLVFFPEGIYKADGVHADYFLGQKNALITLILPACTVALLDFCGGRRLRACVILAAGIIPILMVWCATSIVGLLLMGLVLFLGLHGKNRMLRPSFIWGATLIADYLISVARILDRPGLLSRFITQVLHKNTTLTGRTKVWDAFYSYFFRRPITGYGFRTYIQVRKETFFHAHNTYFQLLLMGGIIALLLFLLFNGAVLARVERLPASRVSVIFTAVLAAVYVMHLAESENSIMSAIILALANNAEPIAGYLLGSDAGRGPRLPSPDPEAG